MNGKGRPCSGLFSPQKPPKLAGGGCIPREEGRPVLLAFFEEVSLTTLVRMHVIHHVIQEDSMKPSNPSRVLTLERGLQILEYIVERRNVTVTNVATAFGIQKSAEYIEIYGVRRADTPERLCPDGTAEVSGGRGCAPDRGEEFCAALS